MIQANAPAQSQLPLSHRHLEKSLSTHSTRCYYFCLPSIQTSIFTALATTVLSLGMVMAIGSNSEAQTVSASGAASTLQQQINSKNEAQRSDAFRQLSRFAAGDTLESQTAINLLIEALKHPDPIVRRDAALALRSVGTGVEAAFPALKAALRDLDVEVRRSAVLAIRSIDATEAIPDLIQSLNDSDHLVRSSAVSALQSAGYLAEPAIERLAEMVRRDSNSDVRSNAATAIARINTDLESSGTLTAEQVAANDRIIVPALHYALEDPAWIVRKAAAEAIPLIAGRADVKETIPLLQAALKDKNRTLRSFAALALGSIGKDAAVAVPDLHQTFADTSPYVRGNTARALGNILSKVDQFGEAEHAALKLLIQALGDPETLVRGNALPALREVAEHLEGLIETNQFDLDKAITYVDDAQKIISDPKFEYEESDIAAAKRRLMRLRDQKAKREFINQVVKNPWVSIPGGFFLVYALVLAGLFWLYPVGLLRLEQPLAAVKGKFKFAYQGIEAEFPFEWLLLLLQYHPKVLDTWVLMNLKQGARETFQNQDTVKKREIHVSIPVTLGIAAVPIHDLTSKVLRDEFKKHLKHLLIVGEGGSGKTSLACRIANWAMEADPDHRLCDHPMIPVLIEEDLKFGAAPEKERFSILKKAIFGRLEDMIPGNELISEGLFNQLLRQKRILLIVDHLSEMSEEMQDVIRPNNPDFPANAVIVTTRTEGNLQTLASKICLRPQRLKTDRLVRFMEDYFKRSNCDVFSKNPSSLLEACGRLTSMVGDRSITVWLARMYADQVIKEIKEQIQQSTTDIFEHTSKSIPELIMDYLSELNDQREKDEDVHMAAKIIAWQCLKTNYLPVPAKRVNVEAALSQEVADTSRVKHLLNYLEEHLQLIQRKGDYVNFMLDPLAEYLAGLWLVDSYGQNESQWKEFLDSIAVRSELPITGFLRAVRDCCQTPAAEAKKPGFEPKVPDFVVERLNAMLDSLNPVHEQITVSDSARETANSNPLDFEPSFISQQISQQVSQQVSQQANQQASPQVRR